MSAAEPQEYVNRPDRFRAMGVGAWGESLREFLAGRELAWRLVWRDIVSRYRQSLLGLGWSVLTPLAMVLVFVYLEQSAVLDAGTTSLPYPLFLFSGLLPWQLFQTSLQRTTVSLVANARLVTRVRFPREILVVAASGGAVFDFMVGSVVLAGFFCWFGTAPAWTVVFVPLVVLIQVVFTFALGLVLSVWNAALRDLGNAVPMIVSLWMFLTPVLYARGDRWIDWLNPMAAFITASRDLAFHGHLSHPGQLAAACASSLLMLPLCWRMFQIMLPRVAETV